MMRTAQRIRYHAIAAILCGGAMAAPPAQAIQIVAMAAELESVTGAALQATEPA
jgi:hypothetical protein